MIKSDTNYPIPQLFDTVGYRNGLCLTEGLVDRVSWTVPDAEARTTKLVDQAMALFRIDGD